MLDHQSREFLSRVVPWPEEDHGTYNGYINLHWNFLRDGSKKPGWTGRAFKTKSAFFNFIDWSCTRGNFRDTYFCTSRQAISMSGRGGDNKAVRLAQNAQALKAIWLDLDVKTPGVDKGDKPEYETLDLALEALQAFTATGVVPPPSAMVGSGGGVQPYWIFNRPLQPAEWEVFAGGLRAAAEIFGLLFDGGCTIDRARILRVPGTFNFKIEPPRPTRLLGLGSDYDVSQLGEIFRLGQDTKAREPSTKNAAAAAVTHEYEGAPPTDPVFLAACSGRIKSLANGLEPEYPPLSVKPILASCGFLRDALATGGKNHKEPLWNLALLCAAHLPDGEKWAHAFSNQHPQYSAGETNEKFGRKVRERDERGIGWPSCQSIHASGCGQCSGCPHFSRGKSPLNLGAGLRGEPPKKETAGGLEAAVSEAARAPVEPGASGQSSIGPLPPGYVLNSAGYICVLIEVLKKDAPSDWKEQPLLKSIISTAWMQDDPEALNFTTSKSLGVTGPVILRLEECVSASDCARVISSQGALIDHDGLPWLGKFMTAWIEQLRAAKKATKTQPFGWYEEDGKKRGFYFGGFLFRDDGTVHPAAFPELSMRDAYSPKGSRKEYLRLTRYVTNRKRSDLNLIVASAFAAPLVAFRGKFSVVIHVCGDTSRGKSTAVKVAGAVYAAPQKTKATSSASQKFFTKRMSDVNVLPCYWDDITKDDLPKAYTAFRIATEGKDGGRLKVDRTAYTSEEWTSIMLMTSNHSFIDTVALKDRETDAGIVRCLEYKVLPEQPNEPGVGSETDAEADLVKLESNYGIIGCDYARMLGRNPEKMEQFVTACVDEMKALIKPQSKERFWIVTVGLLLAGARMAVLFGIDIDVESLKKFMVQIYMENRARMLKENLGSDSTSRIDEVFAAYLSDHQSHSMWTNYYSSTKGQVMNVLKYPHQERAVRLHFSTQERRLRISKNHFRNWLMSERNGTGAAYMLTGIEKQYGAKHITDAALGGGTPISGSVQTLIEIYIAPGSPLEPMLDSYKAVPTESVAAPLKAAQTASEADDGGIMASALARAQKDAELSRKAFASDGSRPRT